MESADWLKATNDTGSGNPERATASKGQQLLAELTEKLAGFFVELAASDPGNLYEAPGEQ